ncbi:MAG: endopeptidase La [bacterium]
MPDNADMPAVLPVLPLRDIVIFPTMIFPLLVGREKTLQAIEQAMMGTKQALLVAQRDASKEEPAPEDLYEVGVIGNILQVLKLPNGLIKVLVEGIERARVLGFETEQGCLRARIEPLRPSNGNSSQVKGHVRFAENLFREYVNLNRELPDEILITLATLDQPGQVADFIMAHLSLPVERKQEILSFENLVDALSAISKTLNEEIKILKIERSIEKQVREKITRSQRAYYLQEQMRVIKKELGEEYEEDYSDILQYRRKIRKARMPKEVKEKANEELEKLKGMPMLSPEASVIKNYLDWLTSLPWSTATKDNLDITLAQHILDEDHYGLEKPKERILEHLAVLGRVQKMRGSILCFVGPPGVGKTSLGRSIARAMGRHFVRVSLGGVRDEAEIRGHRRTYIGSLPGRVIQQMKRAATTNPVFLLDEVDKMSTDFRGDPSAALLEVLDPEQNAHFSDHYLEVDYDLSQVMFITTANIRHDIPLPLQDRMEIIELPGYLAQEKLHIARQFLLPKQLREHGLESGEVDISDEIILSMIDIYTREAGVRELERHLARICRKVARENPSKSSKPIEITLKNLEKFLGLPPFHKDEVEQGERVGSAIGLAWTSSGGEILNIQATLMKGRGTLQLTGQLGDVMKESAQAALSYIRANGHHWGVPEDFHRKLDIHIHIPVGGIPKDGPSAGITLATAMLSALISRPVDADIAMTGELTLRGNVLPIGGLAAKVMAAKRAGIRRLILPEKNGKEWLDLHVEVRKEMEAFFASTIRQVWDYIFPPQEQVLTEPHHSESLKHA